MDLTLKSYHTTHKNQPLLKKPHKKPSKTNPYIRIRETINGGYPIVPVLFPSIAKNPYKYIVNNFNRCHQCVLNALIDYMAKFGCAYPKQQTIADAIGYSRKWVSRCLRDLIAVGFVSSNYRQRKSCVYSITPHFRKYKFSRKLVKLLPALLLIFSNLFTQYNKSNQSSLLPSLINKSLPLKHSNVSRDCHCKSSNENDFVNNHENALKQAPRCPPGFCLGNDMFKDNRSEVYILPSVTAAIISLREVVRLTEEQRAWLACFRPEPIDNARRALLALLKKGEVIVNPFGLVYGQCMKQYTSERMTPNFNIFKALQNRYKFAVDEKKSTQHDIIYKAPVIESVPAFKRPTRGPYAMWRSASKQKSVKRTEKIVVKKRSVPREGEVTRQYPYGYNAFLGVGYTKEQRRK